MKKEEFGLGRRLIAAVALMALAAPAPSRPRAADDDVPAPLGSAMSANPGMGLYNAQGLQNIFTSCMLPQAAAALSGLVGEGKKGVYSIKSECPKVSLREGDDEVSCSALFVGGSFNETLYEGQKSRLSSAKDALACRKGKMDAIRGEVECLTKAADILAQQTSSLQQYFQQNIQRMTQDVAQMDQAVQDRETQYERVGEALFGNKDTGLPGIQQLRDQTQKVLQTLADQVPALKEKKLQYEAQTKAFEEQKSMRAMGLATECFKDRKDPRFQCVPNGPPVTAQEYVLCRYEQQQLVGASGTISRSQASLQRAAAQRAGLAGLLEQIFGDTSTISRQAVPNAPAGAPPAEIVQPRVNIRNVADARAQFEKRLAQYNGKGLDIRGFVFKELTTCEKRGLKQVERELETNSTPVAQAKLQLQVMNRELTAAFNKDIDNVANAYTDALRSLTGMNLPVNVAGCRNGSPNTQLTCVERLQNNLRGIMNGSTPESSMKLAIEGNNPQTTIQFECQGLDGCATKLNNLARNLKTEIKRVQTSKQQYVQRANQAIEAKVAEFAQALSPQSQALRGRLKELGLALSSLGLPASLKVDDLEGEQLETGEGDPPQLYKQPKNALRLIGSRMNPPMLDAQRDDFGSASESLAEGEKDAQEQEALVAAAQRKLASAPAECQAAEDEKAYEALDRYIANLNEAKCSQEIRQCGQASPLGELMSALNRMSDASDSVDPGKLNVGQGLDPSLAGSLATGVQLGCGVASVGEAASRDPEANSKAIAARCVERAKTKAKGVYRAFDTVDGAEKLRRELEVKPEKSNLDTELFRELGSAISAYETESTACKDELERRSASCQGIVQRLKADVDRFKSRKRVMGAEAGVGN